MVQSASKNTELCEPVFHKSAKATSTMEPLNQDANLSSLNHSPKLYLTHWLHQQTWAQHEFIIHSKDVFIGREFIPQGPHNGGTRNIGMPAAGNIQLNSIGRFAYWKFIHYSICNSWTCTVTSACVHNQAELACLRVSHTSEAWVGKQNIRGCRLLNPAILVHQRSASPPVPLAPEQCVHIWQQRVSYPDSIPNPSGGVLTEQPGFTPLCF